MQRPRTGALSLASSEKEKEKEQILTKSSAFHTPCPYLPNS